MRRFLPFFLFAALLCAFISCKKDPLPTFVKGKVIDNKTGAPVAGARVEFKVYIPKSQSSGYDQITEAAISNVDGRFEYILNPKAVNVSPFTVYHTDNVTKNINFDTYAIKLEDTTEFTIPMVRYNTTLQISVKNETGQNNFIYIVIENPTFLSEARASWGKILYYPLSISQNEEKIYFIPMVANEYTKIYWDFSNFISNQTIPAYQDSVYLIPNDTLSYSILF